MKHLIVGAARRVVTRRAALSVAALAALTAGAQTAQAADPVQLKFANPSSPQGHIARDVIAPLAERMNADAQGAVEFKVFSGPGLGSFPVIYDRVINGVADLAFGLLGPISSQFPETMVASLPFETPNAEIGGQALWRQITRGEITNEWQRVKPITIMVFPSAGLHSRTSIKNLADVQGLKFSVQSRLLAECIEKLGGTPITLAVTELYQALQRGTVDAATIGWPATSTFKLAEISHYHLSVPIGGEVTFIVMNKDSYAKLPAKGKAAIDKNIGDDLAKRVGHILDETDEEVSAKIGAESGQTIAKLPPEEEARWKARLAPVIDAWAKSTPDGAKVLAAYRAEISKLAAKK
jgi:TRAP-type C4-dicarboxylate transport system substrate-binding protein